MTKQVKFRAREALKGIRPYTPGKPIEEVKRELGIEDVIKMASNENPLGPAPKAVRAMEEAVRQVHFYPDGNCFSLKEAIAAHRGVEAGQIIVGNGSDEIIKLLAETFINEGDNAVMADPSFSEYEFAVTLMGGILKKVPLAEGFRHDLPAMLEAIDENTRLIFVCNPNNPTGTIVGRREVEDFMEKVPDHVVVVFDEAYQEYVESPDYLSGLDYVKAGRDNVMVLYTFSKIYGMGGMRIGYGIANSELMGWVYRTREPFNVNSLAQAGAQAALSDGEHIRISRETNLSGANYLYDQFGEMDLPYTASETNFIWVNVKTDCKEVFTGLMKQGVIVRTGDIFGYPEYIRVTIGTPAQNGRFIRALRDVLGMEPSAN